MSEVMPAPQVIGAALKYNPSLWSADELRSIFVARERELSRLLKAIGAVPRKSVPQHILITGARGMGKTTLLQRLALAVDDDAEISKGWIALRFPEEQYTVSSLSALWLNVLDALADALDRRGDKDHGIDREIKRIHELLEEEREGAALGILNTWCKAYKRRLVLLMDSTDQLMDSLNDSARGASEEGVLWRLRNSLQTNPNLMWIGASYHALEADTNYGDAFLDFFKLIELKPLSLEQMRAAVLALAGAFSRDVSGEAAVKEVQSALTQRPERLKTLHRLTGGSPRTTVMLYELFAAGGQDTARTDIDRLLDLMTPVYKSRLEALPIQQRKILAHLLENWTPMSVGQLSVVSGLSNTSLSPQLRRLIADGIVRKVALPHSKSAGYQVLERLFNTWYLMRNADRKERARMTWLVEFMSLWFSAPTLSDIALAETEKAYRKAIRLNPQDPAPQYELGKLYMNDIAQCDKAKRAFNKVLRIDPDYVPAHAALANLYADYLDDRPKAELAFRRARKLDPRNPYLKANLARFLIKSGGDVKEATQFYRDIAKQASGKAPELSLQANLWLNNVDLALTALETLAERAVGREGDAFYRLTEQVAECYALGRGSELAALMENSRFATFLRPLSLALQSEGCDEIVFAVPEEIAELAKEVCRKLLGSQSEKAG